ncbi:Alpha-amylase/alpha-mannosidase, GH57 family [Ectothiorhodospira mobilis]|uniref:Alpha-amylase/alpha-mannosidase, GH57 family n=1 Tax=Ectothiorhodospira mobilis TaxID=195064 RepID=A0A1I4PLS2_ECTMO|nr:glycoside hydrolase family 57 protein [Ectothiorhodospira mobilis]SFM28769.1 Alpha-amylase/alpha-mannosidase, GH57 family [Ectothiorhodospira mobilis]
MCADPAAERPAVKLVLCWHMHQPEYRDSRTGNYALPWTYLHAIKDYVDMAAHMEAEPRARAVVNFAPILLEQIEDYAGQLKAFLQEGTRPRDPLLDLLAAEHPPRDPDQRLELAQACVRANRRRFIEPHAPYRVLAEMVTWLREHPEYVDYQGDNFFFDLVTWYHLVWLGETVRRGDPRIRSLLEQGRDFTPAQRRLLLEVIQGLLEGLLGRYRRLAEAGRVELAFSPYAHPILPLLLDMNSAREAMPEAALPEAGDYPGGEARARWHLQRGMEVFERIFGQRPRGCWPSEGAVSDAALHLLAKEGLRWAASGEGVLTHSLQRQGEEDLSGSRRWLYQPYRFDDSDLTLFFRDDGLSDAIGFRYADWHGDDAVANFIHHLEEIGRAWEQDHAGEDRSAVVSVILDGENAWEQYPANGYHFLSALYRRLAEHPEIQLTTFSGCLAGPPRQSLPHVVAGSWVYGNLETWVGDADKNRGWDLLIRAKQRVDEVRRSGRLSREEEAAVLRQLAVCEGSDWCWWFGDYNPGGTVGLFDRLYRLHLARLYHLLGEHPPRELSQAISRGGGDPATGGVMRPGHKSGD